MSRYRRLQGWISDASASLFHTPADIPVDAPAVEDCLFRMLTPAEVSAGMAFPTGYRVLGTSNRVKVRQLGNAVTPPAARDLGSAVAEALLGELGDRAA